MSLLKPAIMQQSFLKMGIYGDAKSGKTYTASLVAVGLHKLIGSKKPVAFFDTETGSEYVMKTIFEKQGVELLTAKSRSFSDLMTVHKEATESADVLIIDSITHVWQEIQKAYKTKHGIKDLMLYDWGPIKEEWATFTAAYLNSRLHVIVCGRAQDIWDDRVDERGKKEKVVIGSKMATEKGLAYEPSLLVEMEKVLEQKSGFLIPRAWVIGDRFSALDGKVFDKPTFETFLPHISMLNLGGEHVGIDTTRSSADLFQPGNDQSRSEYIKRKQIIIEELKDEFDCRWGGMSADQKQKRSDVSKALFGTASKTAIEDMGFNALDDALKKIRSGAFDEPINEESNGVKEKKKLGGKAA